MIRLSVQLASPWIYLAFVATALVQLFPAVFRLGCCVTVVMWAGLAAGFGWQAVFIAVSGLHGDYYETVLHDTGEFITRMFAYALLLALTVTSFFPVRRAMDPRHWRLLHLVGIGISGHRSGCPMPHRHDGRYPSHCYRLYLRGLQCSRCVVRLT